MLAQHAPGYKLVQELQRRGALRGKTMGTTKLGSALRQAQEEQRSENGRHANEVFGMKRCGVSAKSVHVIHYNGSSGRIPSNYLRLFSAAVIRPLQRLARGALLAPVFERKQRARNCVH